MIHFRAVLVGLAGLAGIAATANPIDDYVTAQMQQRHIPGLAMAVIRNGQVQRTNGYGWANLEWRVAVTPATVFEIGSLTKQFTAALVLLLAQEGRLQVDGPISEHLDTPPSAWTNITLRHLLTHTSGIRNYSGLDGFEVRRKLTAVSFIETAGAYPLDFAPGEKFAYCNTGYNLLGYILERRSGLSYWQLLEQRVFRPLGMATSRNRDPVPIVPRRAAGYEWENDRWVNRDSDLTDVFAAGAMAASVQDLVRWNAALNGDRLLSASSKTQMWTPVRLKNGQTYPYGLGWRMDERQGRKVIGHSGSTSGFSASLQRYVEDDLAVIILCNLGEQGVASAIGRGVAEVCLGSPAPVVQESNGSR